LIYRANQIDLPRLDHRCPLFRCPKSVIIKAKTELHGRQAEIRRKRTVAVFEIVYRRI